MANGQGGMRRPQNPAPVSGPGQLSQRTDGGPQQVLSDVSGLAYGENQGMEDLQSAAPMSASGQTTARATRRGGAGRAAQGAAGMGATPLFAPTQRPDEPVTAGAPFGPGPGPMPMSMVPTTRRPSLTETLRKIADATNDPQIMGLLNVAERNRW